MRRLLAILPLVLLAAGLSVSHAEAKPAQRKSGHRALVWKAPQRAGANLRWICQQTKSGRHCFEISRQAKLGKHLWRNSLVERRGMAVRHAARHRAAAR